MKITCKCSETIYDVSTNKGHFIQDTQWLQFLEAIDDAIENSGSSPKEKEQTAMKLRRQLHKEFGFKTFWKCNKCGELFIDIKNNDLKRYSPN